MTTTTDLTLTELAGVRATTAKLRKISAAALRRRPARVRDQVERFAAHAERQRSWDGSRRAAIKKDVQKDVQASLDEIFRGKKKP
jgi:hypothetical protein